MSLSNAFKSVAKSLTKSLGTSAVLKDKTIGVYNPITNTFAETIADIPIQIAPWSNTKISDPTVIQIGDIHSVVYIDSAYSVSVQKDEKIVMGGKTYDVIHIAEYIPQGVTVAYYIVMRLA